MWNVGGLANELDIGLICIMYSIEVYYGIFNMVPEYYLDTSMMEYYGIHSSTI